MKTWLLRLRFVLALVLTLGFGGCEQGPTVETEVGYRGKAKQNPFLAAGRFLEKTGQSVSSLAALPRFPSRSATIIAPAQAFLNPRDSKRVVSWAGTGGHLVIFLQGGEQWLDDWRGNIWSAMHQKHKKKGSPKPVADGDDEEEEEEPLLKELGISVSLDPFRPESEDLPEEKVKIGYRTYRMRMQDGFTFHKNAPFSSPTVSVGPREKLALYSYQYGAGRITVVANAHPFRNRYIGEGDHASLLRAIVELERHSEVIFLRALRTREAGLLPSEFFEKLWAEGWMAIVALAVLIVFWIWKNMARFGPPHAPEDLAPRGFTENLLLTGAFLFRYRLTNSLLEPMRRELAATLASRGVSIDNSSVIADLAARTGLTPLRVQLALAGNLPTDGLGFQKLVADLQLLRAKV
jgi:hypothetical protein